MAEVSGLGWLRSAGGGEGSGWSNFSSFYKGADFTSSLKGLSGIGGGGGGMNGIGYFGKAAVNGFEIWKAAFDGKNQRAQVKFETKQQVQAYKDQARLAAKNYENTARAERDATTMRYNQLRQEVAAQRVGAAASGLDMSSDTARRVERTSRENAKRDITAIAIGAKQANDETGRTVGNAMLQSAFAEINGKLQQKRIKNDTLASQLTSAWNMGNNIAKGIADIYSGGMVSMADGANGGRTGEI